MYKLPSWAIELRPVQITAIQDILEKFHDGNEVVFYEAPTGTGKTLVAEAIRQELHSRGIYLCATISLQHQFKRDFDYAALLQGRSNYPTLGFPDRYKPTQPSISLSCEDCNKRKLDGQWRCQWCSPVIDCPYERAKAAALRSDLACVNSYYFLYEANYVGTTSHRDLVIVDECDKMEDIMMSFIQVDINERRMKEFELPYPGKKTVMSSWIEWAKECHDILTSRPKIVQRLFADVKEIKQQKRLDNLIGDVGRLLDPTFGLESGNWIYDGYKENNVVFKPIVVAPYAREYLWRHGKRWLLMSATIISEMEMARSLGLLE